MADVVAAGGGWQTGWPNAKISDCLSVSAKAALAFLSGPGQFDMWIIRQQPPPRLLDDDSKIVVT